MKKGRFFLPLAGFAMLLSLGVTACGGGTPKTQQKVQITAAESKTTLVMEETVQLTAEPDKGVTWSSNATNVATVHETSGLVTAVGPGSATITAKKNGYRNGTITITVTRPAALATLHFEDADHFAADGWWGSDENGATPVYARTDGNASGQQCIAHMENGDKETLTFTSTAAIKAELVITMASSSSNVELSNVMAIKLNTNDVSLDGKTLEGGSSSTFQEVSLGELDIATSNTLEISFTGSAPYLDDLAFYTKQNATIAVVRPAQKEAIETSTTSLNINRGGTAQINITKPVDLTGVSFTSDNSQKASVTATGLVTGEALGEANIIVSRAGMLSVRIPVTVTDEPIEGEIRVEAEVLSEDSSYWEELGFHRYTDRTSGISFGHSGGAYITGYDVSSVVSLTYTVASDKDQTMIFVIAAAPHYNMQAGEQFKFGGEQPDATMVLNDVAVVASADAIVLGDGAAMGAKTQNVIIGEVNLRQGNNTLIITFNGKAPALDCFKFLPKNA